MRSDPSSPPLPLIDLRVRLSTVCFSQWTLGYRPTPTPRLPLSPFRSHPGLAQMGLAQGSEHLLCVRHGRRHRGVYSHGPREACPLPARGPRSRGQRQTANQQTNQNGNPRGWYVRQRHRTGLEGETCRFGVIREGISEGGVLTVRRSDEEATGKPIARDGAATWRESECPDPGVGGDLRCRGDREGGRCGSYHLAKCMEVGDEPGSQVVEGLDGDVFSTPN